MGYAATKGAKGKPLAIRRAVVRSRVSAGISPAREKRWWGSAEHLVFDALLASRFDVIVAFGLHRLCRWGTTGQILW